MHVQLRVGDIARPANWAEGERELDAQRVLVELIVVVVV